MPRRMTLTRSILAAACALFLSGPVLAQEQLPEGVTLDIAANAVIESLPDGLDQLVLYRMSLASETRFPIEPGQDGVALVEVEAGTLTANAAAELQISRAGAEPGSIEAAPAGEDLTLEPGDSVLVPDDLTGELRNEGEDEVSLLVLEAVSPTDAGDEEPMTPPAGVAVTLLASGATPELGDDPVLFWIGEFALEPGAAFPGVAQPGVEIAAGLAGAFTMRPMVGPGFTVSRQGEVPVEAAAAPEATPGTVGEPVTFGAGDAVYFPDGNAVDISNEGDSPAIAIFGGIGPAPSGED